MPAPRSGRRTGRCRRSLHSGRAFPRARPPSYGCRCQRSDRQGSGSVADGTGSGRSVGSFVGTASGDRLTVGRGSGGNDAVGNGTAVSPGSGRSLRTGVMPGTDGAGCAVGPTAGASVGPGVESAAGVVWTWVVVPTTPEGGPPGCGRTVPAGTSSPPLPRPPPCVVMAKGPAPAVNAAAVDNATIGPVSAPAALPAAWLPANARPTTAVTDAPDAP